MPTVTLQKADRPTLLADSAKGKLVTYRIEITDFDDFMDADKNASFFAYVSARNGDESLTQVCKRELCNWRLATDE